jgi:hypothetical protein
MQVWGLRVLSNYFLPDELETPKLPIRMSIVIFKVLSMELCTISSHNTIRDFEHSGTSENASGDGAGGCPPVTTAEDSSRSLIEIWVSRYLG